jgi:putative membrane protein
MDIEPPLVAAARGVIMDDPVPEPSRTDLAEDRTILANERTFAGWMRTALACVAIGVGFHALFLKMHPSWMPRAIATAFLLLAIVVIVSAQRRAAAVMERLSAHVIVSAKPVNLRFFAAAISLGSLALIAAIWLLELQ